MLKSHILQNYDLDELEENINEFLAKDGRYLINMHMTSCAESRPLYGDTRIWHTVVLIYQEDSQQN